MNFFQKLTSAFSKKSATYSNLSNLIEVFNLDNLVDFDGQKAIVKKAYFTNGDVYSISSKIARNAANIPRKLYEVKGDGRMEEVTSGDFYELVTISPNTKQTAIEYRQESLTYLLTRGNSFNRAIKGVGSGVVDELTILDNDYVTVRCGVEDLKYVPKAYGVRVSTQSALLSPDEVMHVKYFNPSNYGLSNCVGLSPLEAGLLSLMFSTDTKRAQSNIIKTQGAKGFLTNRSGNALTAEDKDAIQKAQDSRVEGAKNFGKLIATSANIDFVSTAMDANQLKLIESSVLSLRDMCNIYGVDSSLFNDPENKTYNNRTEAEKAMFTNAVVPVNEMDIMAWNKFVSPGYSARDNKRYVIKQDLSALPVLHQDEVRKSQKNEIDSRVIISILESGISSNAKVLSLMKTLGLSKEDAQEYVKE